MRVMMVLALIRVVLVMGLPAVSAAANHEPRLRFRMHAECAREYFQAVDSQQRSAPVLTEAPEAPRTGVNSVQIPGASSPTHS